MRYIYIYTSKGFHVSYFARCNVHLLIKGIESDLSGVPVHKSSSPNCSKQPRSTCLMHRLSPGWSLDLPQHRFEEVRVPEPLRDLGAEHVGSLVVPQDM